MVTLRQLINVYVLTCMVTWAAMAVEVTVQVPDAMLPGQTVQLVVDVKNMSSDLTGVQPPQHPGLIWGDLRPSGQQVIQINRETTIIKKYRIAVRLPEELEQDVTLPGLIVRFEDGTQAQSEGLVFRLAQTQAWLEGRASARVLLEPEVIVPGQAVTLTYELAVLPRRGFNMELDQLPIQPPAEAIILEEQDAEQGNVFAPDGKQWNTYTKRWRFTMPESGSWQFSGQQNVIVVRPGFFDRQRQLYSTAVVEPVTLLVKTMPAAGQPNDFSGLIAPLDLTLTADRDQVRVGEGLKLSLVVTTAQPDLLFWPQWSDDAQGIEGLRLRQLDSEVTESGKVFYWNAEPLVPGSITLPALSLPFFNPETGTYERARSHTLTIEAIPGRQRQLTIVGQQPATQIDQDLVSVDAPSWTPLRTQAGLPPQPFWLLGSVLVGLVGGGCFAWLRRPRGPQHRGRMLAQARQSLNWSEVHRHLGQLQQSYPEHAASFAAYAQAAGVAQYGGESFSCPQAAEVERLS